MTLSRRKFLTKAGLTVAAGVAASVLPVRPVRAHGSEEFEVDIEVAMGEFYFQVEGQEKNAPIEIEANEKHFIRFTNEGSVMHEVHFGREPNLEERFYDKNLLGTEGQHDAHGFMALILMPGEAATVQVWVPDTKKGEWEIGCFMLGHYESGQHAPLIVI